MVYRWFMTSVWLHIVCKIWDWCIFATRTIINYTSIHGMWYDQHSILPTHNSAMQVSLAMTTHSESLVCQLSFEEHKLLLCTFAQTHSQ